MRKSRTKRDRQLNQAVDLVRWWQNLCATNNETFLPLFFDEHKHLVLKGSAGSGKSIFAGRKILERCATEAGHRMLVVRKVAKTLRESCFDQLKKQAYQYYPDAIKKIPQGKSSDMYLLFKNGSEIIFAGLDDVEKLKSIHDITGIWIEEASELDQEDFAQLDIRLRGDSKYYQQIILTFNPVSITHWLKKRFFDEKDPQGRVRTHESTYKDNRFLEEKDRITLEDFKRTDPYYYQVYCLGQWGVIGQSIFDKTVIGDKLLHLPKPEKFGEFAYDYNGLNITSIRFVAGDEGEITVYESPKSGHPYVIGCDTAGEGSDWFVAQVLDNSNGRLVAKYRVRTDEDLFARKVYCLGMWYNTALIGVEANFSTHPIKELERMNYPKLYMREVEDSITRKLKMSLGFRTDSLTRPLIISELKTIMREHPELINDEDTLNEMLTFGRNSKGRPEAAEGAHDDCIMALAIAYYIRTQQSFAVVGARTGKKIHWERDMYEDYYRASPEEQALLIARWGNPFD
ncbi:MAG: PBSX family phage terminase large subunit [Oscillospiraceae bacterium]|nr:PBSX family phage terminase large subunit [Oscillospiraceae bacterium]